MDANAVLDLGQVIPGTGHIVTAVLRESARNTVYEAEEPNGRRVAAKLSRLPTGTLLCTARARGLVGASQHPNIARISLATATNEPQPRLALFMERLAGASCRVALQRRGRLPLSCAVDIGEGIFSALAFLHGTCRIHGRITPEKVFVHIDELGVGHPKLLLSTQHERESMEDAYAAPETPLTGPSERADVFSVAATLFELVTGAPFSLEPSTSKARPFELMVKELPSLRELDTCSPTFEALLRRGLAAHPFQRITVREALDYLRRCRSELPTPEDTAPLPVVRYDA